MTSSPNPSSMCDTRCPSPSFDDNIDDIEATTVKELNKLSKYDRERVFEEVHGIATVMDENPDIVSKLLCDIDEGMKHIHYDNRSAYDHATTMLPDLRNHKKLRLMFLRASYYDPSRAAIQMARYFDSKLKLFGEDKLVKHIVYDDLNADDKKTFMTGVFQILRSKDQAGRNVLFWYIKENSFGTWQNQFRSIWFQLFADAEQNEEAQQKGIVLVVYYIGHTHACSKFDEIIRHIRIFSEALPFRVGGIHFCYDHVAIRPVALKMQYLIGTNLRLHFRKHYGCARECQHILMTYGIPKTILPVDHFGAFKKDDFLLYVLEKTSTEQQQQQQQQQHGQQERVKPNFLSSSPRVSHQQKLGEHKTNRIMEYSITDKDVLIGMKGGQYERHPGNLELSKVIQSKWRNYYEADRFDKTCIIMSTVRAVNESHGRFLKYCDESKTEIAFFELTDKEARSIVSHRFRNCARTQVRRTMLKRDSSGSLSKDK